MCGALSALPGSSTCCPHHRTQRLVYSARAGPVRSGCICSPSLNVKSLKRFFFFFPPGPPVSLVASPLLQLRCPGGGCSLVLLSPLLLLLALWPVRAQGHLALPCHAAAFLPLGGHSLFPGAFPCLSAAFYIFFFGGADESKCILHGISLPSGAKWCWLSCPSGVPCLGAFSAVCPAAKMQSQQAVCASSVAGEQDMRLLLAFEPLPGGEGCAEQCVCSL